MPSKPRIVEADDSSEINADIAIASDVAPVVWTGEPVNGLSPEHLIKAVQAALALPETGEFTDETSWAVREFQVQKNLPNTGTVDKATWDLLM